MLVRVKKGLGNYGHVQNGHVQPKNYDSGSFEVSEAKGRELIERGIVDEIEGDPAPAPVSIAEAPKPQQQPEKPAKVEKKATKKTAKTAKKAAAKAEDPADDAPKFDAIGGVE